MNILKKLTAVGIGTMSILGGVDASSLSEQQHNSVMEIAGNDVILEQIDNSIETTFRWKDQQGLKVKVDLGEPTLAEKVKDKRKKEVITETVTDFDGGFKVDILLNEKPTTNRFCYTIEGAENYDFFYQPPLTEQEKAEGAVRPPEIEGSYAVYHKTLKNHVLGQENYATGKVMHIPRPQVWEMGNEEATKQWADLSYENGQLCVTAPQDFIDNADYTNGVRIDPTFGYTSIGATGSSILNEDTVRVTSYQAPSTGTLKSISVYATANGGILLSWKGVIYNDDTADSLVGNGNGEVDINTSSGGWFTNSMNSELLSGGTNYLIGWWFVSSNSSFWPGNYDSVGGINLLRDDLVYSGGLTSPNDPFVTDATTADRKYSVYATYEYLPPATMYINNGTIRINNGTLDL